jgi:Tfp pilus assembly protein PilF
LPGKQHSNKKHEAISRADTKARHRLAGFHREVLYAALLLIATLAIYSPVRAHPFVNYDDGDYVTRNTHIQAGPNWQCVRWALTTTEQGNWHPLTWISHAIDCQYFGLDPAGHHLTNLGVHFLNVALLAWLLSAATGAPGRSVLVAALFALHPLNVESVAWVAEQKNVLSTFFFLLTLAAYGRYARRPGITRYLFVLAAFVLALASKPMVVTLPFILLLLDYWPLQRTKDWIAAGKTYPVPQIPFTRCVTEKIPLFALSAASCVITVAAQGGAVMALDTIPPGARLENAAYSYLVYLWKAVFPMRLGVFYPHPGNSLGAWQVGFSVLVILAAIGIAWAARVQAPYLIVGWLWFLGTLVPVIGVVQVGAQAMADRYAYIPLIGFFVVVIWGIGGFLDKYRVKALWRTAAAVIVLLALSWLTRKQLAYWSDSCALWSHALEVTRDNPFSENQLGMALLAVNRQDEAMKRFQRATALGTRDATSYLNIGAYLTEHGRHREAIPVLQAALGMFANKESQVLTHLNLGFSYTSVGDYQNASLHYREALQLDPEQVAAAIQGLAQFVAVHPSARDYMKLGLLLEESHRNSEAAVAFERSLQLDPNAEAARTALTALQSAPR